jgi:hypothetical protein
MTESNDKRAEKLLAGTSRTVETHAKFEEWMKAYGSKKEDVNGINLASTLTLVEGNLYKNEGGDVFELSDGKFTLVIDPKRKYRGK